MSCNKNERYSIGDVVEFSDYEKTYVALLANVDGKIQAIDLITGDFIVFGVKVDYPKGESINDFSRDTLERLVGEDVRRIRTAAERKRGAY